MQALKLFPAVLEAKVLEGTDELLLFEEDSSLKNFYFGKAKHVDMARVNKEVFGYKLPPNTASIIQIQTRDREGHPETQLVRKGPMGNKLFPKQEVANLSPKLLELVASLEEKEGCPLKLVFGKSKGGTLFLIHKELLSIPTEGFLKVLSDLLGKAKKGRRKKILRHVPLSFGGIQTKTVNTTSKPVLEGTPVYPGLFVVQTHELFIKETSSPADAEAMKKAKCIITGGGTLSHAAILASSEGIPCIVGVSSTNLHKIMDLTFDTIFTVDAYSGKVYVGTQPIVDKTEEIEALTGAILKHARPYAAGKVYANADTPEAIAKAFKLGAEGIGLLRTEHMYQSNVTAVKNYLDACIGKDLVARRTILAKLLNITRELFQDIFLEVGGRPLNIRLLDAPFNEFLNDNQVQEVNPMMGLRGCRFGIVHHDFYSMQVQAIAEAYKVHGDGEVGIMIPLISEMGELIVLHDLVRRIWGQCRAGAANLRLGAMVETPRACLISGELAQVCDFLSYGTNDLTQFTYAFSRDDASFLSYYTDLGVLPSNPFTTLDPRGVGRLLLISAGQARAIRPEIKLGLCGQHAGDLDSIALVRDLDFDYVSCTVGKIPSAVLATME